LTISDEQSAFNSISELDSSRCNELLLAKNSSTSSWTSESQFISIDSESSLLDSSATDQISSSNTSDDSNCYEVSVSGCSPVVTNGDINGDTVSEILREQQTAWEDEVSEDPSDLLEPSHPIDGQMICDIQSIASSLAAKAEQLIGTATCSYLTLLMTYSFFIYIGNFTTNLAESYIHIRTKFDGGKQINRSQRGSWQGRCAGAALRMNDGPEWGPQQWEKIVGLPASCVYTAISSETLVEDRKRKLEKIRRKKTKRSDNSLQSRLDYSRYDDGPNVMDIPSDIPP